MIAPLSASSSNLNQVQTRSDGDSDSDWDDDDDFVTKRINIRIKPITQVTPGKVSASMDELRATVGTWKSLNNINLVKPNSRRSQYLTVKPQQAVAQPQQQPPQPQTAPLELSKPYILTPTDRTHLLPVALAVQECLNVYTIMGLGGECTTSLLGHLKMAIPRRILEMDEAQFEGNELVLNINSSWPWSDVQFSDFVKEVSLNGLDYDHSHGNLNEYSHLISTNTPIDTTKITSSDSQRHSRKIIVDMKKVYTYARKINHHDRPLSSHILLPELLNYKFVKSLKQLPDENPLDIDQSAQTNGSDHSKVDSLNTLSSLNPIQPITHWLCDTNVTKVRVDFEYLETKLAAAGLEAKNVTGVKISLQVDGGVESHQSKPPAVWSSIESRLTWSFSNLDELLRASTLDGITSCLAKFNLSDGPSKPDSMEMQFAIQDKSLGGTQVSIDASNGNSYRITRLKKEVRTGRFRCEPPFRLISKLI